MALRHVIQVFLVCILSFITGLASGQTYPNKSIRIVTSPAGGSADFVGRLIAQGISGPLGQPVIVENRTTALIDEIVSKAAPDGYTLALVGQGFWVSPHVKSGRLRALAVTTAQPSALLPGVPTVAASGLIGFEASEIIGVFAPGKTPVAIINRLNQEIVRVVNQAELRETFGSGLESFDRSPEAYAAAIKSSRARMGKVIKDLGLGDMTK